MSNMTDTNAPESPASPEVTEVPETAEASEASETQESFQDLLKQYDQSHASVSETGQKQINATVAAITADSVLLDIGYKTEGILPLTAFTTPPAVGDSFIVTVKGRDEDGYYQLSLLKFAQPKDFSSLEEAFAAKGIVAGTVTAVVKGGLTVDVGARAFLPASRSGTRDAAEMEKLVGQQIRVRITKLDVEDEDVVVDRRSVVEEEEKLTKATRLAEIQVDQIVHGTVRSLAPYGAFVDIGGTDGLLHISDMAWTRVTKPEDVLTAGDELDLKVLKIDPATGKISLGLKQLLAHPWDSVPEKYKIGDRVTGTVSRDADFGSFVELEPGVEGLVHISEMSWGKKVRKPSDMVKIGDTVEAVILSIDTDAKRIGLGLKQALGDPWADVAEKFPVGSAVEAPVVSFTKFGAFVQLAEGIEGMIHISEITAEKRLNHPTDVLRIGEVVKAQILDVDKQKRQVRLSIKQLIPSDLDEFLADHKQGDTVTGRIIDISNNKARVELGEGIFAPCILPVAVQEEAAPASSGAVDLSAFSSLLKAKWQGAAPAASAKPKSEVPAPGQIRSFRISTLNLEAKQIELELA
ncbi:S1 RNA-binding domain-containing protein [Granulicella sp. dw_53]|uniref:S1 RNA-binding domain-containing protein n=1 Tax=Granulicella sp. dw_53 TaxID=2719792 RepID=UPI0021041143|nr:S1 RNA-binding domain-containing protein [Granulicella sp. dw_53]